MFVADFSWNEINRLPFRLPDYIKWTYSAYIEHLPFQEESTVIEEEGDLLAWQFILSRYNVITEFLSSIGFKYEKLMTCPDYFPD